jgi:hypothetical protein
MTIMQVKKIGFGLFAAALAMGVATQALAVEMETTVAQMPGSAAAVVDTITASATIQAIDKATRDITYVTSDGLTDTFTAGPAVRNFDQLAVGDQVNIKFQEAVAVYLGKDAAPSADAGGGIAAAPLGATPGGVALGAAQLTVKVLELDKETRQAKLELPNNVIRQVKVRDGLDLSQVQVGDSVTVAIAQGLAIEVVKP